MLVFYIINIYIFKLLAIFNKVKKYYILGFTNYILCYIMYMYSGNRKRLLKKRCDILNITSHGRKFKLKYKNNDFAFLSG